MTITQSTSDFRPVWAPGSHAFLTCNPCSLLVCRYNNPAGGATALHAAAKAEGQQAATVISLLLDAGASPSVVTLPVRVAFSTHFFILESEEMSSRMYRDLFSTLFHTNV